MSAWGGSWGGGWGGSWGAVSDEDTIEGVDSIVIEPLDYDEEISIEIT